MSRRSIAFVIEQYGFVTESTTRSAVWPSSVMGWGHRQSLMRYLRVWRHQKSSLDALNCSIPVEMSIRTSFAVSGKSDFFLTGKSPQRTANSQLQTTFYKCRKFLSIDYIHKKHAYGVSFLWVLISNQNKQTNHVKFQEIKEIKQLAYTGKYLTVFFFHDHENPLVVNAEWNCSLMLFC